MSTARLGGVDTDGFILTVDDVPVQAEFQSLLADVCATLAQSEPGLDGIYLYGSIARGDASPGVSDLDLTLVFNEPAHQLERLELTRLALEKRHPEVTKIDFDSGHRTEVLAPENKNKWGFWLKHHCRCLWGNNLALCFERFRPSRDIALALNGDFEHRLAVYRTRIDQAATAQERLRLQREAARKLIRATHTLRPEGALTWPHTLEEHVAMFVQRYPAMITHVAFFLFEARNPSAEGDEFLTRLDGFLAWRVLQ